MAALYRDYRPQTFGEIIGQDYIKRTLQNAVASGTFAHAYLFTGIRGTGKTSTARILARAINSPTKTGEPDNETPVSKAFLEGSSLDLVEIDAASNTGVENIREIIDGLKFSPTHAKYKVFIIDEVHMLSKGAFNALLKTLEEPPAHAVFILATTEIQKVPATVVSRTQRFDFKKISREELRAHLKEIAKKEKLKIDDDALDLIVTVSEGSVRDALSILDKLGSYGEVSAEEARRILGIGNVETSQKLFSFIAEKNGSAALNFLQELFDEGVDPVQLNKDLLEYLRLILMLSMGANVSTEMDEKAFKVLKEQTGLISQAQLLFVIRLFLRAAKDFQNSPYLQLPLEIAVAESCIGAVAASATIGSAKNKAKPEPTSRPAAPAAPVAPVLSSIEIETADTLSSFNPTLVVSEDEFMRAWPDLMKRLREKASTLFAVMKNARLKNVSENKITLAFAYKFHKDSLDNKKNREILLNILSEHFKTNFLLEVLVEKEDLGPSDSDAESLAVEVFG